MDFKSPKLVIFNFYAQIMPRRFLVDTTYVYIEMCCVIDSITCVRRLYYLWLCKAAGN